MKRALQGWYVLGLVAAAMGCSGDPQGTEVAPVQSALSSRHACADVSEDSPLAQAACSAGILIGSAIGAAPLANDPEFPVVLDREFVYVTPENEMKWGSLQPVDSESWDFTGADAIVAHANAAGQLIKGHTLVWHAQLPSFVTEDLAQKELAKLMRKHIKETVTRYRDDVDAWDVVNEAVNGDGSLRESVFYNVLGPDYIAEAFKLADKYSRHRANACKPHKRHRKHKGHGKHKGHARREGRVCGAELYYNDYGIETVNAKSDGVRALLADLLDRGVRVDGVGIQGHWTCNTNLDDVEMAIANYKSLGLKVSISELDVAVIG